MAKCDICGKIPSTGHKISITRSQISRRANRVWKPNVKKIQIVTDNGTVKKVHICMKCLRSNKVKRAV
jgi:large subunit ribosomal protein L28